MLLLVGLSGCQALRNLKSRIVREYDVVIDVNYVGKPDDPSDDRDVFEIHNVEEYLVSPD